MDETIYQMLKDFYTHKAEYEMNMQQLQRVNQRLTQDVETLRKSFNDLRDNAVEHVERLHS